MGAHTLLTGQRERERKREGGGERKKERERGRGRKRDRKREREREREKYIWLSRVTIFNVFYCYADCRNVAPHYAECQYYEESVVVRFKSNLLLMSFVYTLLITILN